MNSLAYFPDLSSNLVVHKVSGVSAWLELYHKRVSPRLCQSDVSHILNSKLIAKITTQFRFLILFLDACCFEDWLDDFPDCRELHRGFSIHIDAGDRSIRWCIEGFLRPILCDGSWHCERSWEDCRSLMSRVFALVDASVRSSTRVIRVPSASTVCNTHPVTPLTSVCCMGPIAAAMKLSTRSAISLVMSSILSRS